MDGGRSPGSAERRRAYRAAMRRHGLRDGQRVIAGGHTERSGTEAGRLLLAERDAGTPLPAAVLAGNDRSAMGLLMALTRAGWRCPATSPSSGRNRTTLLGGGAGEGANRAGSMV
ncbi:hypothetical protein GCM10010345_39210 [Streptomyces canarius]|uniref:Transcriptional regulator LacI/GalR-like sensor domain-containing protein n=1 Tax=Streptomyces canarius TaxID=285453 RepID=A0ABQ3CQ15_9ACTN|nr:hypothetical protein GCM10010345_39210 [Streptomyces canarius]